MIANLFIKLCQISPRLKTLLWRQWYQFLAGYNHQNTDWKFMNYGYAPLDSQEERLELNKADELDRYWIQLYHHVASAVDLKGLDVLEVGSGRGGGASYIKRYLKPKTMVGVDFSEKAVAFCNRNHPVEGLSFVPGNAESLPFEDNWFDAVVNVESSHGYSSMDTFLGQVRRVLRPGGYFLYADLHGQDIVDVLLDQLRRSEMILIRETNITPNVLESLRSDNEYKEKLIKASIPKSLIRSFQEFAGVEGTRIYEGFRMGKLIYLSFVFQKPKH